MCFGAVGGLLTSCFGACALRLGCAACGAVGGMVSTATRLTYALMLLFATFAALAMLADWVKGMLLESFHTTWLSVTGADEYQQDDNGNWFTHAKNSAVQSAANATAVKMEVKMEEKLQLERLVGSLAVYRIMLGVAAFHGLMALALVGVRSSADVRAGLQNSAWSMKLIAWLGLIVVMFVLPTEYVRSFAGVFLPGACLFLVIQVAMLVAGTYDIYSVLVGLAEAQTQRGAAFAGWAWLIILMTASFYGFSLFVFGATVARHSSQDAGCSEGVYAVCLNMLGMILTTVLSISPRVREAANGPADSNGVFQSGMVAAYANWQVFSALLNHPSQACHLMDLHGTGAQSKMMGLLFTFIAVLWSAVRNGSAAGTEGAVGFSAVAEEDPSRAGAFDSEDGGGTRARSTKKDDEVHGVKYSYSTFHGIFALAACYIAMLLTRWGEINDVDRSLVITESMTSVWIKIVLGSWTAFVLYALLMLLPPLCPDRTYPGSASYTP